MKRALLLSGLMSFVYLITFAGCIQIVYAQEKVTDEAVSETGNTKILTEIDQIKDAGMQLQARISQATETQSGKNRLTVANK